MKIWNGKCVRPEDICCVCGSQKGLTRHHVVPACYRTPLHHDRDYHDQHDVVFACHGCHDKYEMYAKGLRYGLCERYDIPMDGIGIVWPDGAAAMRGARALIRHGDRIPAERAAKLRSDIVAHLGREPGESDMLELAEMRWQPAPGPDYVSHGELLVAQIEDMNAFWRMWRAHFVNKMKPRFLPADWSLDRDVRWSPERCRMRRGPNCTCTLSCVSA